MDITIKYGVKTTDKTVGAMLDVWTKYGVTSINDMDFYTADCEMYKYIKNLNRTTC